MLGLGFPGMGFGGFPGMGFGFPGMGFGGFPGMGGLGWGAPYSYYYYRRFGCGCRRFWY